jgi:hypothetical protein
MRNKGGFIESRAHGQHHIKENRQLMKEQMISISLNMLVYLDWFCPTVYSHVSAGIQGWNDVEGEETFCHLVAKENDTRNQRNTSTGKSARSNRGFCTTEHNVFDVALWDEICITFFKD